MRAIQLAVACVAVLVATAGQVQAGIITFESDPIGSKPNGFTSTDSLIVHFSDSFRSDLILSNFGSQGDGISLATFGDDASELIIDFDVLVDSLSLSFGNDDPGFSHPGDLAFLTLFNGIVQVGQTSVVLNRNDIMDQTISFSGPTFNQARFAYTDPSGVPINLTEIVDNVQFNEASVAAVPEPSSLALFGIGACMIGIGACRRRRREKQQVTAA